MSDKATIQNPKTTEETQSTESVIGLLDPIRISEEEKVSETPSKLRKLSPIIGIIATVFAITMSIYHLGVAFKGTPEWLFHRTTHVMFAMVLGFMLYKVGKKDNKITFGIDMALAAVSFGIWSYIMINYERIVTHMYMVNKLNLLDYIIVLLLFVLIFELTRRTTGWPLIFVALFFIFYTLNTQNFPGVLKSATTPIPRYLEYMFFTADGLFGSSVSTSASFVFLFVMLGAFLEDTGVGDFFISFATEFTQHLRGGPGKCSVLASGLFGSISGSAVANVYATGVFTIPMMKKGGFSPTFSGAVEAVSSSGGAIMPPVMGSAAFLMADFVGVPYITIAKCAIIPAVLYYVSIWLFVDTEAQKLGMEKSRKKSIDIWYYIKHSYLIIPIIAIISLLILGYSASFSAFCAILLTLGVGTIKNPKYPLSILKTLEKAGKQSVAIAIPLTCASIVVGSINLTGVGLRITSMIIRLANGQLPIALLFTMIITIILGMGLPTPAAYLIVAIFAPSAITQFGVPLLTAHLFVFYFASFSTITPPVAMAAYAGGALAGADINRTGFMAMKLGIAAYLIPFVFIYDNALLLDGSMLEIFWSAFSGLIAIYTLVAGAQGLFMSIKIPVFIRPILLVSAIFIITPVFVLNLFAIAAVVLTIIYVKNRNKRSLAV